MPLGVLGRAEVEALDDSLGVALPREALGGAELEGDPDVMVEMLPGTLPVAGGSLLAPELLTGGELEIAVLRALAVGLDPEGRRLGTALLEAEAVDE